MAIKVCAGAMLKCSMGMTPSPLTVLPIRKVLTTAPAANIEDNKPNVNIMPFGMCKSQTNPAVQAVMAATSGSVTQAPCIPATTLPWTPGTPSVLVEGKPALNNNCQLMCQWAGVITIDNPGQTKTQIAG